MAPIHDSFGVHACNAKRVKEITRDSIVKTPTDMLDKLMVSQGLPALDLEPLDKDEFMKSEHFMG